MAMRSVTLGLLAPLCFAAQGTAAIANRPAIFQSRHASQLSPPLRLAQSDFNTFFEEGRTRSETRLPGRPPTDPTLPVRANSDTWQPIISQAGGFSLWMPPGVLSAEDIVLDTAIGPMRFQTLATNAETSRYVAAFADLDQTQARSLPILTRAVRGKVAASPFQLTSDRDIQLQNQYPGREITLQSQTASITIRAYLVGRRLYILGAKYPKATTPTRQANGFLNSFEVSIP